MNGRILAIDFGLKRVGAAICDREGKVATPLETYHRRSEALDAKHYAAIGARGAGGAVGGGAAGDGVGRRRGSGWSAARAFGDWLGRVMGVPVVFFDERYTTVMAEELLARAGVEERASGSSCGTGWRLCCCCRLIWTRGAR